MTKLIKIAIIYYTIFIWHQLQKLHDGSILDLPPVLFGKLGNDPSKKTVMVYGHLDVQPALKVLILNQFLH